MILYFEYYGRRQKAEVDWPKKNEPVTVHITDPRMLKEMPADLLFEINDKNKVVYTIENPDNKRLTELQNVLAKRLQEFVNKP